MPATPIAAADGCLPEPPSQTRSAFRRDCDRVIHSTAFRRLKHKTQVFVFHEGDHYRTRLTHTLEVAQIARALARQLGLDEDLTETLALAHDLGHPPFGHAGERALDACLQAHGGFDHNAQTLRVVTSLEHRYPDFDGLNLTWETLEGIVKHNGPLTDAAGAPVGRYRDHGVPPGISEYDRDLRSGTVELRLAGGAGRGDRRRHRLRRPRHRRRPARRAVHGRRSQGDAADGGHDRRDRQALSRPRREPARRRTGARADLLSDRRRGRRDARAGSTRCSRNPPRTSATAAAALVAFPRRRGAGRGRDQGLPEAADVSPRAGHAGDGRGRTILVPTCSRATSTRPSDLPAEWLPRDGAEPETETEQARRIGNFIAGMTDRFAHHRASSGFLTRPRNCVRRRPSQAACAAVRSRRYPRCIAIPMVRITCFSRTHLFANVLARVHAVCSALAADGVLPAGIDLSRIVVEPPRDAVPWRHGDQRRDGAGQGGQGEAARSRRGDRRQAARRRSGRRRSRSPVPASSI